MEADKKHKEVLEEAIRLIRYLDGKLNFACTSLLHDHWSYGGNPAYLWMVITADPHIPIKLNIALRHDGFIEREMCERLVDGFMVCKAYIDPDYYDEYDRKFTEFYKHQQKLLQETYTKQLEQHPSRAHASREGQLH